MQILLLKETAHPESFALIIQTLLNAKDIDRLSGIMARIKHIAGLGGHPAPPYAKPLQGSGKDLNEIRCIYDEENLLRIYYFVDRENQKMVLMNAIIKPDGEKNASRYDGGRGKKLEKDIQKSIQTAQELKIKYTLSPDDYEQLSI